MPRVTGADAKAEARARARASRRTTPAGDPAGLARQGLAFAQGVPGPPRVTCYLSYGTEPETRPLLAALTAAGFTVLLPRVVASDLEWVDSAGPRATSSMGIDEPTGPAVPLLPVRALLIPALVVSGQGARLGKGGGFYDRVLTALPAGIPVAAIVRDEDVIDDVPMESHDRYVDAIITPTRVIHVAR